MRDGLGAFLPAALAVLGMAVQAGGALEGNFRFAESYFPQAPAIPGQAEHFSASMAAEPSIYIGIGNTLSLRAVAFARLDQYDSARSHFDIREARLLWSEGPWNLVFGIDRVAWGVAESRHLVDVANQSDWAESVLENEKLGQPMLGAAYHTGRAGKLEGYLMTGFRPRTFPGPKGRPGFPIPILADQPSYESALGRWRPDAAVRWSRSIGALDCGLSYFYGTARDPELRPEVSEGRIFLRPAYRLVGQGGLDAQGTWGPWILKLEALVRSGQGPRFAAMIGGMEYSLPDLFRTGADLHSVVEYDYDGRRNGAFNLYDDDLFLGFRWARNDVSDTQAKGGVLVDVESGAALASFRCSRRIRENWKVEVQGTWVASEANEDPLWAFRHDGSMTTEVRYSF